MTKRRKNQPVEEETLPGEVITGPREYTLKKPIVNRGEAKVSGDKVVLSDRQAERLKGSGHI